MSAKLKASELTKEENLFQLYWLSRKFPKSRFNVFSTIVVGFLCGVSFFWVQDASPPGDLLRATLVLGLSLAPSILGFLIAGFTVFVTITKPGVFSIMAKKEFSDSGESYLKYNLSAFMLAFAHYLAYLAMCVILVYFGQPNGMIVKLVGWSANIIFGGASNGYRILVSIAAIFFACWTWYLVMLLKSFIYNVYQVVVTGVRWDLEEEESLLGPSVAPKS